MKHVVQFEIEIGDEKLPKVVKALKALLNCLKWKVSNVELEPQKPDPFEEFKKAIPNPPWNPDKYPAPPLPKPDPYIPPPQIPYPRPRRPWQDGDAPYYWMDIRRSNENHFTC